VFEACSYEDLAILISDPPALWFSGIISQNTLRVYLCSMIRYRPALFNKAVDVSLRDAGYSSII
jgi:hypothetical protein